MPSKLPLRSRLARWKPPRIDLSIKPKGPNARAIPERIAKMRMGGIRWGEKRP